MTLLHGLLLGLVQGLTEFLPLSSTAHLLIVEELLRVPMTARDLHAFNVLLHTGSVLALIAFYGTRLWRILTSPFHRERDALHELFLLFLGTLPAALVGFFLQRALASSFHTFPSLSIQLLISAGILILVEFCPNGMRRLLGVQAIVIGMSQAFALVPGFSRTGLTISAGRAVGLAQRDAVDFSFLLAFPIIVGGILATLWDVVAGEAVLPPPLLSIAGVLASFAASALAITVLQFQVDRLRLGWFAVYLVPAALLLLGYHYHAENLADIAIVRDAVERYGAIVILAFALLETIPLLSLFSPGLFALVIAGAFVRTVPMALSFLLAAFAGIALGNTVFYVLGRTYGRPFARRLGLAEERLGLVERFMGRFGRFSVVFGQFIGSVRPIAAFVGGTVRMRGRVFYPWMLLGSFLLGSSYLSIGFLLRQHLQIAFSFIGFSSFIFVPLAILIVWIGERKIEKAADVKREMPPPPAAALPPDSL